MDLSIRTGDDRGRKVTVGAEELVVGRDPGADLVLEDDEISRFHASFRRLADGGVELKDLGSRNGTFVDGALITEPRLLQGGEQVRLGETVILVEAPATAGAKRAAAAPAAASAPGSVAEDKSGEGKSVERSVRRLTILAALAGILAIVAIVLIATGAFDSGGPPSPAAVIKSVTPSTVLVLGKTGEGEPLESGSGWVYNAEKGLIVTNAHVASGAAEFEVGDSDENLTPAEVVGVSPCDDLAVLKTKTTSALKTLPLGSQSELSQGDEVFVVGYPGNASIKDDLISTEGSVSAVETTVDPEVYEDLLPEYPDVVQTDAAINHGNSGGPMVDDSEKLVGINTLTGATGREGDQTQGQYYAIGVDHVREVVPGLARGHSKGWFGFNIDEPLTNSEGEPVGLLVDENEAVTGTAAQKEGFGSTPVLVTEVNGQHVGSPQDYCEAVKGLDAGTVTEVGYVYPNEEKGEEIFFDGAEAPERLEMRLEG
jgi:S1-C subfamily serine protease